MTTHEGLPPSSSQAQDLLRMVCVAASAPYAREVDVDLYGIQSSKGGPIKIGVTRDVYKRLDALQTASPYRLELKMLIPGMGIAERTLHSLFADHRLSGEWFDPAPAVLDFIGGRLDPESVLRLPVQADAATWGSLDRYGYEDAIRERWPYARRSRVWSDCQRILGWRVRQHGTLTAAHEWFAESDRAAVAS